jgi:endonuclease/exonuclease/phosphatase (EEP) superfamily protein YafD
MSKEAVWCRRILFVPALLAWVGMALAFVPGLPWPLSVAGHFWVQYGVVLVVTAVFAASFSHRRRHLVWLLLGVVVNGVRLLPLVMPEAAAVSSASHVYRALFLNIHHDNTNSEAIARLIQQADADIVAFVELMPEMERALGDALSPYAYVQQVGIPGYHARVIYSRLPVAAGGYGVVPDRERPSAVMRVLADERPLTIIAAHLNSPIRAENEAVRAREKAGLAAFVQAQATPVLLLADLNDTPWHADFLAFLQESGLRNGRDGQGLHPTWPTTMPPLMLPIDHALITPDITIHSFTTLPAPGSDHRAILIEFSLNGAEVETGN